MFDELLRRLKDRLLEPLARRAGPRVSPQLVTLVALAVGLAAALLAARGAYHAALGCWLVNRLLDGFDGALARVHGRQSDWGGYLDIVCDFVVYAAIPIGLAVAAGDQATTLAALALVATFYVNAASWMYLAALLERRGAGARARGERTAVTMPAGLVAGAETVLFYSAFLLVPGQLLRLIGAMTALVIVTIVQRVLWARRVL
jgi:phosphatidylglycerophosphate synthase